MGTALPRQSIDAVSPDFVNLYAIHSNVQVEQALTNDLSFTIGYIHSSGRHIPVYRNINCQPVASQGTSLKSILRCKVVKPPPILFGEIFLK